MPATHARRPVPPDPAHEVAFARHLLRTHGRGGLLDLYARFSAGEAAFDVMMRRLIARALMRRYGDGIAIAPGVRFVHPETIALGRAVFIGAAAIIQGRVGGRCTIGERTWIGPQCFLDARDLRIGAFAALGPGVRILGSAHIGGPRNIPIIRTDLRIAPVRIGAGADIGTSATILPGVTIGRGSIVGAGAVVAADVPSYAVVAGVPARLLRRRTAKDARDGSRAGERAIGT